MTLQQRFIDFIRQNNLFSKNEPILLTVSGGVDSVAMVELFHQAKFKFGIIHCNFQLRGKESDGDEKFVHKLADKYGAAFYSKRFETSNYAEQHRISIQMAARELRYEWFEEIRKKEKYKYIATAHHQNDLLETMLINLIRGTGIAGLQGIKANNYKLIRPMLFTNRHEIESFAEENKIKFREDSSNVSDDYVRNKIRHHVIPILKDINPSLEKTFVENSKRFHEANLILDFFIDTIKHNELLVSTNGDMAYPIDSLQEMAPQMTIFTGLFGPYNFREDVIKDLIKALEHPITGKQFLSTTHRLIIDRNKLIITELKPEDTDAVLQINEQDKSITLGHIALRFSTQKKLADLNELRDANLFHLDKDLLTFPLTIRKWKNGDYFYPLGMSKKKKLSDFMIDNKIPLNKKEQIQVVLSKDDIVCILGHRIDNRYRISKTTKTIFTIDYSEKL